MLWYVYTFVQLTISISTNKNVPATGHSTREYAPKWRWFSRSGVFNAIRNNSNESNTYPSIISAMQDALTSALTRATTQRKTKKKKITLRTLSISIEIAYTNQVNDLISFQLFGFLMSTPFTNSNVRIWCHWTELQKIFRVSLKPTTKTKLRCLH